MFRDLVLRGTNSNFPGCIRFNMLRCTSYDSAGSKRVKALSTNTDLCLRVPILDTKCVLTSEFSMRANAFNKIVAKKLKKKKQRERERGKDGGRERELNEEAEKASEREEESGNGQGKETRCSSHERGRSKGAAVTRA